MTAEAALKLAIAHLREGVQILGFDWRYLYVNATAAAHGQRPADQLLGRTITSCYPGIEATPLFEAMRRVMQTRQPETMRNEFVYPDGGRAWFDLVMEPVPDGLCVLSLDVTDKHRLETQLHQEHERTRFALRAAQIGVWELRLASGSLFCSETFEQIAGVESAAGPRTWDELRALIDPSDLPTIDQALSRAKASGAGSFSVECRLVRPDGRRRWVDMHARFLPNGGGLPELLLGVGIDITERRTVELQLQQAQKMEAIGQLAGGVAHDFNNLLTAILGYCDLLLDGTPDDARRADLEEIKKAGVIAASLTSRLLAFSRKQLVDPKVLDLNAVISDTGRMLQRMVGEDVEIDFRLASALDPVKADPGQMDQVLMNLVVNARDAMPRGGKLTIETANVWLDEAYASSHLSVVPGPHVMLAVADTGTGMTPDVQARLFEPFFTTKDTGKGTGLGLASVYGIVKQCGGNIWVYSEPDYGTTFKIYFPRAEQSEAAAQPAEAPATLAGVETILVVEDSLSIRALVSKILQRYGYSVLLAASPDEATSLCGGDGDAVHLLLTDVVMPGTSGPSLAAQLTSRHPGMRVLYMSGYTDDAIVRHGLLRGEASFLQKPFAPETLARKVRQVLDNERGATRG